MPALDHCQPAVVRALEKAGWLVIDQPLTIRNVIGRRHIYADLRLKHRQTGLPPV
jgi:hypothetical protein